MATSGDSAAMKAVGKHIEKFERMAEIHACKSSEGKFRKSANAEKHYSATISNKEASGVCFLYVAQKK